MAEAEHSPAGPLRLTVINGNLSHARYPVIVGHFANDPVAGCAVRHDTASDGAPLPRYLPGTSPGGVAIGLGIIGDFSAGTIRSALAAGLIELARGKAGVARIRDTIGRVGDTANPVPHNGAAMVLIGTRSGVVPLTDTLAAMLDALVEAQRRLADQKLRPFTKIQIFATMEDAAHAVWHTLDRLIATPQFRGRFALDSEVAYREGAARRITPNAAARRITRDANPDDRSRSADQDTGEPDWRLSPRSGSDPAVVVAMPGSVPPVFASPAEAIAFTDTIRAQIKTGSGRSDNRDALLESLTALHVRFEKRGWLARPHVAEALGRAFAALDEPATAIALFDMALHHDAAPSVQLIEQRASLRLRAAVAPLADGSFAPDALARIAAVRADITALCSIAGATVERLTLIGATHKREALLQTGAAVDATLATMRDCYRAAWTLAHERGDANAYYPGQLVVEAGLLIDLRANQPEAPASAGAATRADLAQLAADLGRGEEQRDDYWHAASRAGYLLFEQLAAGTLSAAAHDAIVHCYDTVLLRCGSNFEFETTLSDMRYMRTQLGSGNGAAAAAWIAAIEAAIARLEA